jgi:hypothetical protein
MHINQRDSKAMEHLTDSTQTQQITLQQQQTAATPLASAAQTPRDYYTGNDSTDTDEGQPDHIPLAHRQNVPRIQRKTGRRYIVPRTKQIIPMTPHRNIMRLAQIHRLTHLQLAQTLKTNCVLKNTLLPVKGEDGVKSGKNSNL